MSDVSFPACCWQEAIGTMPRTAVRVRVMRIIRGQMRMRISAGRGGDIGAARMLTLRLDTLLCRVA
jgi:hypothetical protein